MNKCGVPGTSPCSTQTFSLTKTQKHGSTSKDALKVQLSKGAFLCNWRVCMGVSSKLLAVSLNRMLASPRFLFLGVSVFRGPQHGPVSCCLSETTSPKKGYQLQKDMAILIFDGEFPSTWLDKSPRILMPRFPSSENHTMHQYVSCGTRLLFLVFVFRDQASALFPADPPPGLLGEWFARER